MPPNAAGDPDTPGARFLEQASFALARQPESVTESRHRIAKFFRGRLRRPALARVELLVSEIVTNAIRHGDGDLVLVVTTFDDRVRVDVHDSGPGFVPVARRPPPGESSGWGLYLVAGLADSWGVAAGSRTQVWFEISAAWSQPSGAAGTT